MRAIPQFVIEYIRGIETLVSPARHLPADARGVITGGHGETDKSRVHEGMKVPESLATAWLTADLTAIGSSVEHIFAGCELSDRLFGALVDFLITRAFTGWPRRTAESLHTLKQVT